MPMVKISTTTQGLSFYWKVFQLEEIQCHLMMRAKQPDGNHRIHESLQGGQLTPIDAEHKAELFTNMGVSCEKSFIFESGSFRLYVFCLDAHEVQVVEDNCPHALYNNKYIQDDGWGLYVHTDTT